MNSTNHRPNHQPNHLPKLDLTTFFLSISSAAMQALQAQEPNFLMANQNIELLELMLEKTRGNRTPEEDQLVQQLLFQLRMSYVERESKTTTTK